MKSSGCNESGLTRREFEVISLIVFKGCTNQELADSLCISEKTVKNHVANIFKKMNITSVRKLMSICMSALLVDGSMYSDNAEYCQARLVTALNRWSK
ncbi:response regulator transcription factor [Paenibacillus kobensis]|uniref:response regulator transcription factor n=1 Tax=Paenibacillus kobensis TaxID=59841 RepID=UPI000FD89F6C|nr:LuxR C-terminal-related transcriptional regulator [Paenibacillus kobensis]